MDRSDSFEYPDADEFLGLLGISPQESKPTDGFWAYQMTDADDVLLRLSFDVMERSVQTSLFIRGRKISTVCNEGAKLLSIVDSTIRGEFEYEDAKTTVEIRLKPKIEVSWSTLRTA